jgi:TetR/AcrR family transcriptional repressor of nem operon
VKSLTHKKADRTRQHIIEKAAPIFNKKGIAGTSLSDLTHATGLTKGSIYGNFKDKDEVAVSVFKYNVKNLTEFLSKEINNETTCVEKLLALPKAYRKLYKQMIEYGGCPILNTAAEADDTHKILSDLTVDAIETMKETIIKLIERGKRNKEVGQKADSEKMADITISLIEGGSLLSKVTGNKSYMMNSMDQIEDLFTSIAKK